MIALTAVVTIFAVVGGVVAAPLFKWPVTPMMSVNIPINAVVPRDCQPAHQKLFEVNTRTVH